jgi:hypothetical protein
MKISEIKDILEAEVLTGNEHLNREVMEGCASDLMSDVLAFSEPHSVLLTGLTTLQAVYSAEMSQIKAIAFVRGKLPTPDVVALAQGKGITLLATNLPLFESCGKLYHAGLLGTTIHSPEKSQKERKTKTKK